MSKKIFIYAAAAVVLAGSAMIHRLVSSTPEPPKPAASAPGGGRAAAAPLRVTVHEVAASPLSERIHANGTLLAEEEVSLQSEIAGKIVALNFREGARVHRGELLVKINDSELQAQLQRTLHRAELGRVRLERQRFLVGEQGTSQEAFDAAMNEWRVLEAEADLIRAQLEKTEIRAPFDGVVGLRYVSEGSYITPTSRIATLQSLDRLKLEFSIPERYVGRVPVGSRVNFSVSGMNHTFEGEVYAIEPKIDINTRMVLLRALVPEPDPHLFPGAFASVHLSLRDIEDALLIPTPAVVVGLSQKTIYVIENGRAVARAVETGIRTESEIQITEGLAPGDIVVTSGILQIRPGMAVEPDWDRRAAARAIAGGPNL